MNSAEPIGKKRKISAVLFDVDGTLRQVPLEYIHHCQIEALRTHMKVEKLEPEIKRLADLRQTKRFINEARDFLEFMVYLTREKKSTLNQLHSTRNDGHTLDEYMAQKRRGVRSTAVLDDIHQRYRDLRDGPQVQKAILPIPGALESLRRMCSSGIPVCLVSNAAGAPLKEWLIDHGLKGIPVVSKEEVQFQKPHPQGIQKACRKLRVKRGMHVAYVGDKPNDVIAAKRAGVRAIAMPYQGNREDLRKEKPDHLFAEISEIEPWLEKPTRRKEMTSSPSL